MTITRFAPSPSGHLHLGHAYSALFAERAARDADGKFLLRIEDIDHSRCRPEFETAILDDLTWLGMEWDAPVVRQSERFTLYQDALERLAGEELIYPCFCTRKEIQAEIAAAGNAPHGPDGPHYPGTCRRLEKAERQDRIESGESYALRLDTARAASLTGKLEFHDHDQGRFTVDPGIGGDIVLARKDTPTSYHLAVTVDDAAQEVSLVTRGEDLLPACHIHRLLQALLDLPEPRYRHHTLLTDEDGKRFAKRDRSLTLQALRAAGASPDEIRGKVGF
ncbi:MAG TPA: tRNA glutamyl-Q(34) synthetase GluQRS [Rhodospirillaceae bacterium]|nr:tRNA glutamyl-Q(34) synthetase GluQRS [Rhodospirillaceae bacterium]HAA91860.1 tRNA glutamyl-Q(34) synthetase GluQRS [Rhodospirillaceae bacterium]HAT36224.1 tRNA glutamyl-Q(34) synthetase GluQRS [Rhodospirillaceae bacterium]